MKIHEFIVPIDKPSHGDVYTYHVDPMFDSTSQILVGYCFTTVLNGHKKISEKIISRILIEGFPDLILQALHEMAIKKIKDKEALL